MDERHAVDADNIMLGGLAVRGIARLAMLDSVDALMSVCTSKSAAERNSWQNFKPGICGVRRIKWTGARKGRTAARADLLARFLRTFKHGKDPKALLLAEELEKTFPNSGLVQDPLVQPDSTVQIEDVDTSTGQMVPRILNLAPSRESLQQQSVQMMASFIAPDVQTQIGEAQGAYYLALGEKKKEVDLRKLEADANEVETKAKNRSRVDLLKQKIAAARELGNKDMENAFFEELRRM